MCNPIGQTITEIRPMTDEEMEYEGWEYGAEVIVLSNGNRIYASQDDEGNGPGELFSRGSSRLRSGLSPADRGM